MEGKKLHILHLPSWYIPEGGQFCRNQVVELNKHNVEARILANVFISIRKYGFSKILRMPKRIFLSQEDGIEVLRNYHISIPFLKKIDNKLWIKKTVRMFDKYCERFGKPDVIHVHSVLWAGIAAKKIKEKYNIPYIITEHRGIFGLSCEWAENQFAEWQDGYMQEAFSNADLIIPVSDKLIPKIQSFLKKEVPIQVVSNMVDTNFFYVNPKEPVNENIRAVMVNGLSHSKAYDVLFQAIDLAMDTIDNLTLNIVGEDFSGDIFENIWEKVRHKERITLAGELDAFGVREALWNGDFFIISSRVESQSVSTLEALSTGLPTVCTEVVPLQIANESNSIRVPVENVQALAEGIIEMSKRYYEYDRMKIATDLKVIADNSVVAEKLIEVYRKVRATSN